MNAISGARVQPRVERRRRVFKQETQTHGGVKRYGTPLKKILKILNI